METSILHRWGFVLSLKSCYSLRIYKFIQQQQNISKVLHGNISTYMLSVEMLEANKYVEYIKKNVLEI